MGLESRRVHATSHHDDYNDNNNDVNNFDDGARNVDIDDHVNVDNFIDDWPRRVGAHSTRR